MPVILNRGAAEPQGAEEPQGAAQSCRGAANF